MKAISLPLVLALLVGGGTAALWVLPQPRPAPSLEPALWDAFAARFTTAEGRVIDRDNGAITHSEGQGYGMLLAEAADRPQQFAALWQWTTSHLRRPDGLFSWKYGDCPQQPDGCVLDRNDASDGDILMAWALLRAYRRWGDQHYLAASRQIAAAAAHKLVVNYAGRLVLLPAADGFRDDGGVVVNLSYWLFPAFSAFAKAFDQPLWRNLADSGWTLVDEARFGPRQLPSDWIRIEAGVLKPDERHPPRFGYDAVRIPLNLVWDRRSKPERLQPFAAFWSGFQRLNMIPAWIDLVDGAIAPYPPPIGTQAIAKLTMATAAEASIDAGELPPPTAEDGYYSTSLALLSRIAARNRQKED